MLDSLRSLMCSCKWLPLTRVETVKVGRSTAYPWESVTEHGAMLGVPLCLESLSLSGTESLFCTKN